MGNIDPVNEQASLLYFTSPECHVCKVLKPKVRELIEKKFPKMTLHFINVKEEPNLAGQHQVFTVPVLLVFFEGSEFFRKARNISIFELEKEIGRPYALLFEN